ncbi:MAG: Flp family type IVb pilin [Pseudomonadota bacterium]
MTKFRKRAARLCRNESGANAVEYGLIMALMTIALLGAIGATGSSTGDKWNGISDDIGKAMEDAGV